MDYEGIVYRPPSEAYSLIIQVTIGCSHNKCTFCSMYKDKKFRIRKLEDVLEDLKESRKYYRKVEKIFLADGDALIAKREYLVELLNAIRIIFPECKRVSIYGSPNSILIKKDEELREFHSLGLDMVYMGVETGSDMILEKIKKGVNSRELIEAGRKIVKSDIKLSVTLISGIGGKEYSVEHAVESAKVINEIQPNYIGLLTLLVEDGTELYEDVNKGKFILLRPKEVLHENRIFVENLYVNNCIFRSNHASNYVSLRGTLMKDKEDIIAQIDEGLKQENLEDEEIFRSL